MPWNKGKKLSLETRVRMSLAKQGRTHSRATRRSMSRAHLSLSHSPVSHAAVPPATGFVSSQPGRFRLRFHKGQKQETGHILDCLHEIAAGLLARRGDL